MKGCTQWVGPASLWRESTNEEMTDKGMTRPCLPEGCGWEGGTSGLVYPDGHCHTVSALRLG